MSHEEENLSPGERELEAALGRLAPSPLRFTLQQLEARALIRIERRRTRIWQSVAAILAIAAGAAFLLRSGPRTVEVEKIVFRDVPQPLEIRTVGEERAGRPLVVAEGEFGYLRLRDNVLLRGVDSLRGSGELPAATQTPTVIGERANGNEVRTPWYVDYLFSGGRS
jgi:hypothetical protein